jgi:ketosteroid isomerase-like protein
MKKIVFIIMLFLVTMACMNQPVVDKKLEGEKLMQLSQEWSDIFNSGDPEKIFEGWADDAVVMVPGMSPLKGIEAIKGYVKAGLEIPGFSARWEPLEVFVSDSGDMAYMIERNEMIVNDTLGNPIVTYNKTVTVWRKENDGNWKNVIDMWNEDPNGEF